MLQLLAECRQRVWSGDGRERLHGDGDPRAALPQHAAEGGRGHTRCWAHLAGQHRRAPACVLVRFAEQRRHRLWDTVERAAEQQRPGRA